MYGASLWRFLCLRVKGGKHLKHFVTFTISMDNVVLSKLVKSCIVFGWLKEGL